MWIEISGSRVTWDMDIASALVTIADCAITKHSWWYTFFYLRTLSYIYKWNFEKYWWNKICIFIFHYKIIFTGVKHIFRIFTGLLPDYFLLIFGLINMISSKHQFLITTLLFRMTKRIIIISTCEIFIPLYENQREKKISFISVSGNYTIRIKENTTKIPDYIVGFLDCTDISLNISTNDTVSITMSLF